MPNLTQSQPGPSQQKLATPQEDSTKQLQLPVPPNGGPDSQPRPTESRQESSRQESKIHQTESATPQSSPAQPCPTVPAIQKTAEISKSQSGGKDENRWQKLKNKLNTVPPWKNKLNVRKEIISPNPVPDEKQISAFWIIILLLVGMAYLISTMVVPKFLRFFVSMPFLWIIIWLSYGAFCFFLLRFKSHEFAQLDKAKIEYLDLCNADYKGLYWMSKRADLMTDKYKNEHICSISDTFVTFVTVIGLVIKTTQIVIQIT